MKDTLHFFSSIANTLISNKQRHHWDCSQGLEQRKRGKEVARPTSKSKNLLTQTQYEFDLGQERSERCA